MRLLASTTYYLIIASQVRTKVCRVSNVNLHIKELPMLHYSVVFLVIALIAAIFGFGGIAAGAVEIAKILFFIFAALAIIGFVVSLIKKN